jgi:hypothetical protein
MTIYDIVIDVPFCLAILIGLAVLIRYHSRSRLAATLGIGGLCGFAVSVAVRDFYMEILRWICDNVVSGPGALTVYDTGRRLLFAASVLLLIAGVVTDRGRRPPNPSAGGAGE